MKDAYVAAAHHYLDTGMEPAPLVAALTRVMQQRGHERLLRSVLRSVVRERSASRSIRTVARVNDQASCQALQAEISAACKQLNATETPTVVVDPTLIGGFQLEANYQRVDTSHKQQLLTLYRNITNHTT